MDHAIVAVVAVAAVVAVVVVDVAVTVHEARTPPQTQQRVPHRGCGVWR